MSVEQAEEAARKLAASIEEAIGRITLVYKNLPERNAKHSINKDQAQPGS